MPHLIAVPRRCPRYALYWLLPVLFVAPLATASATGQQSLLSLERRLERQFSGVANIVPRRLEQLMSDRPGSVVLLDVREGVEYAVSHLNGAVRVDPAIATAEFARRFAGRVAGRTVVLYCSVGYRSSQLAARVQAHLFNAGAKAVYNLRGGIFAWHNTGRPVVRQGRATDDIHPYSRRWSYYLDFDNYADYGGRPAR